VAIKNGSTVTHLKEWTSRDELLEHKSGDRQTEDPEMATSNWYYLRLRA
jgi:hypothetical protein